MCHYWLITALSDTDDLKSDARVIFKPGKQQDGWFDADNLLAQVERAIKVFERLTNRTAQALFVFDNAPSHQKRAADAISAHQMVKGALSFHLICASSSPPC